MEQARREHIQAAPIFCMRLSLVALRDHHKRVQAGRTCAISYLPRPRPASRGRQASTGSSHPWSGAARFPIQQPDIAGASGNPVEGPYARGDTLLKRKSTRCGTTHHHPKTVIVVTVVWIVVVAVGRARVVLIVVPRAAAHDASIARLSQAQLARDKPIQRVEGAVAPELARQIADWQATRPDPV